MGVYVKYLIRNILLYKSILINKALNIFVKNNKLLKIEYYDKKSTSISGTFFWCWWWDLNGL